MAALALLAFLSAGASSPPRNPNWHEIGTVEKFTRQEARRLLGQAYGRVLGLGPSYPGITETSNHHTRHYGPLVTPILARSGHAWEGREILKRASLKHHFMFALEGWPPGDVMAATTWRFGRREYWVQLGYTRGANPDKTTGMFGEDPQSILGSGGGDLGVYEAFALAGHLWEGRTLLKRIAIKHHFGLILKTWPLGSNGKEIFWENGHVVPRFSDR